VATVENPKFKHLFAQCLCVYPDFAVGISGGLRSQGGVKLPTGGNALRKMGRARGRFPVLTGKDEQTRCDPGADG